MSELKWNWAYYPYLDPPEKQAESALKAGYIKVVNKDEADKVIAELKSDIADLRDDKKSTDAILDERNAEIAELKDKALQYKVLYKEKCRDINTQERFFAEERAHDKYKRCLAMAWWCSAVLGMLVSTWESKIKHYKKWQKRWLELAEKFKEAK